MKKLKKMLAKLLVRLIPYKDGQVPKGTLKGYVYTATQGVVVYRREEDGKFFLCEKLLSPELSKWRELVFDKEYPDYSIYDTTQKDTEALMSDSDICGKVEGEDRYMYFKYKTKK